METAIRAAFAIVGAVLGFAIGVLLALALGWFDKPSVLGTGGVGAIACGGLAYLLARRSAATPRPGRSRMAVAVLGLVVAAATGAMLVVAIV